MYQEQQPQRAGMGPFWSLLIILAVVMPTGLLLYVIRESESDSHETHGNYPLMYREGDRVHDFRDTYNDQPSTALVFEREYRSFVLFYTRTEHERHLYDQVDVWINGQAGGMATVSVSHDDYYVRIIVTKPKPTEPVIVD